jgi:hypothetical protein
VRLFSAVLIIVACAALAGSCKRTNARYCDESSICPLGHRCDLTARECVPIIGGDAGSGGSDMPGGCNCSGTTPVCVPPACFGCQSQVDPEASCSAISTATPHCLFSGASAGSCVGCRDARDCTDAAAAICDAATHACRPCNADSDCPSLVCDLTSPTPERGRCVDPSRVVYVDMTKPDGNGLSIDSPRQTIPQGIDVSAGTNGQRPFVHVAPTGVYSASVTVDGNRNVFLVGENTIVHAASGNAFSVNSGGQLTLRGFIVTAPLDGASCSGSTASLTAYRTQFVNSGGNGISTSNCPIKLDGCWLDSNGGAGVITTTSFDISNSIITRNKTMGGLREAGAPGTGRFVNNTVADNVGSYGVDCSLGPYSVQNTILYNNQTSAGGGAISETSCPLVTSAADITGNGVVVTLLGMPPGFRQGASGADAYHLAPNSPCINKGSANGVPDHDYDGEPRPDPTSHLVDIGADEVQ